jgi:radical SAM superfamily enzyme
MSEYQKQCPIDGGTCGQGGTCYVCENEALGSELTAAKARIAELEKAAQSLRDHILDLLRSNGGDDNDG